MWVLAASLPVLAPWLYKDPIWRNLSPQSLEAATLWMYRAWAICSVSYWSVKCLPEPERPQFSFVAIAYNDRLRIAVGSVGLFASLIYIVLTRGQAYSHIEGFSSTSTFDQIIHELRQFSKIYVFLYFFERSRGHLVPHEFWLLSGTLMVYTVILGASASKGVAIEFVAMWALGSAAGATRRQFFKELTTCIIGLTLLYWIGIYITAYRVEIKASATAPTTSIEQAIDVQFHAATQAFRHVSTATADGSKEDPYDINSMLDRLGYLSAFAMMLDITDGVAPHENAFESLLAPLFAILPRSLFLEKANFFGAGEFAGLLGWQFGGFSVTLPGSLFWAWGFEGLMLAMAMLGIVLAALGRRARQADFAGRLAQVLLISMVLFLLDVGQYFQAVVINCVRIMLLFTIINCVVAHVFSTNTRPGGHLLRGDP